MNVDLSKLRALLSVLSEENISEFEHEDADVRIRIVRGPNGTFSFTPSSPLQQGSPAPTTVAAVLPPLGEEVTSPFVGTFYRASSPDVPAFVQVGSVVKKGQVLCIIEAMKLMNEIEAELSGTIMEVYAENGKPVEFGQKLFLIKP